jgi:hypothetical protein
MTLAVRNENPTYSAQAVTNNSKISPEKRTTSRWWMKRLVTIPADSVSQLERQKETGLGYQLVSVQLKDGRHFEQAVASEGCIIAVRGHEDVPFAPEEVEQVAVTHSRWNFRESSDVRRYREISAPIWKISKLEPTGP